MKNKKGFTLIEILVVVLIIGILAAIAVPYYQESVEKSIMQEAIVNLRTIAQANDRFFLANGRYATSKEIEQLDISIPGTIRQQDENYPKRVQTTHFLYSPDCNADNQGTPCGYKAYVQKLPDKKRYGIGIKKDNTFICGPFSEITSIQRKLCDQINQDGHL